MQKDLLEVFLKINNYLGHVTVQSNSTTNRYHSSGKKYLIANTILLFCIQLFFLSYTINTSKVRYFDRYGVVLGIMFQLDGQLTLCLNLITVLNGALRSKDIIKLLNALKSIRLKIKVELGGPQYALVWFKVIVTIFLAGIIHILLYVVFPWVFVVAKDQEDKKMELVFVVLTVAKDAYWMMISMILIVMKTEISFIGHCFKSRDQTQFQFLLKALAEIVSLMDLFAKCFSIPIMFALMLLFFDGTLQLFQFVLLIESVEIGDEILEVVFYIMWFLPYTVKLCVVIHLATITSNKVSAFNQLIYQVSGVT